MGKRIITEYYDDITGETAEDIETTAFTFEGVEYEIDLNQRNYNRLREFIDPYVNAARKVGGNRSRGRRVSVAGSSQPKMKRFLTEIAAPAGVDSRTKIIRAWYEQQEYAFKSQHPLKANGRIPRAIEAAYDEAHGITSGGERQLSVVAG